jgi:hypothetical protein
MRLIYVINYKSNHYNGIFNELLLLISETGFLALLFINPDFGLMKANPKIINKHESFK